MNFLGHFYLSYPDPELLVGNFIADFVKGRQYLDYPPKIAAGIMMHRKIDDFTDHHVLVRQGRKRLFGKYRHYSGVIMDMYYDHFLANLWPDYSEILLPAFSVRVFEIIENNLNILPERSRFLFPYMKRGNWLLRYTSTEGLGQSLMGMSRRINHDSKLDESIHELHEYYDLYKTEFQQFIEDIKNHFNTPG